MFVAALMTLKIPPCTKTSSNISYITYLKTNSAGKILFFIANTKFDQNPFSGLGAKIYCRTDGHDLPCCANLLYFDQGHANLFFILREYSWSGKCFVINSLWPSVLWTGSHGALCTVLGIIRGPGRKYGGSIVHKI
jgi:hypothetical protein